MADVFRGVVNGVAQITGTSFFHVRVGSRQRKLPGLVSGRRHPSVCEDFIWRVESGEIAYFSQENSSHTDALTWDSGNGRLYFVHDGLNVVFNIFDFGIQFTNQANCVL